MNIKKIVVGALAENCYLLEKNNKIIIIDPGDEADKILKEIKDKQVVGILLTHNHFDHIGALSFFEERYNLKHNNNIENFNYEIIETPGHSKDSLTFFFPEENIMFTGDFLFKGTIGRMDLPGGDVNDMQNSLEKISKYNDNIVIYPGHSDKSLLGLEKTKFKYYI